MIADGMVAAPISAPISAQITGLVLAGGEGRRMGGLDKGLLEWNGQPLAWHALQRLRPQVGACAISANRHLETYRALGVPVWTDASAADGGDASTPAEAQVLTHAGPLAGLLAGLTHCATPWLLTVPCDVPHFPADLAERLAAGLRESADAAQARMAVAWARSTETPGEALRPQPVFCLIHRSLRGPLAQFLAQGGRRAMDWATQAGAVRVDFDRAGDVGAFRNINTPAGLQALTGRR